ncbi:MAG: LysM peptidoglycan-binding domain-containing protein [Chloroflexi bacterium]|nr:LysM peptidoglycan-binding domain-containing protein [Chloroflexota bacterium]
MVTVPWLMLVGTPKAATDLAPSPTATRYGAFQPTASPTSEPEDLGTSSPPEEPRVHVVQPGDSLYGLAQRYGTTVEAIAEANGITDPRRLSVGQELVIP